MTLQTPKTANSKDKKESESCVGPHFDLYKVVPEGGWLNAKGKPIKLIDFAPPNCRSIACACTRYKVSRPMLFRPK